MSRRPAPVVLLVLSLLLIAAGGPPSTVATDACGDPTTERDTGVTPWTDLCSLSLSTAQVDGSLGETVTELTVALEVVSTSRATPSMFRLGWEADGCAIGIVLGDATPRQEAISAIGARCGEDEGPYDDCLVRATLPTGQQPAVCRQGLETIAIAPPTVAGSTYTWSIRVEGAVADVIGRHAPGTALVIADTSAGPRVWDTSNSSVNVLCVSGAGSRTCAASGGDVMYADTVATVD